MYTLISDYRDRSDLRQSFNQLAKETFGIDFEAWYQEGYWNDNYRCYSYLYEDQVVANVSVNQLTLKIEGQVYKALQIGTVMTHPDHRRRGLAYKLLDHVMTTWQDQVDFIYLFGNDLALDLYKSFNMVEFRENRFFMSPEGINHSGKARQLDLSRNEDKSLMVNLCKKRVFASDGIGIQGDDHLLMFYCRQFYADHLYYLEGDQVILAAYVEEDCLHLVDVLWTQAKPLEDLLGQLPFKGYKTIEVHFKPEDRLIHETRPLEVEDQTLLIRSEDLHIKETFRFSSFSHA